MAVCDSHVFAMVFNIPATFHSCSLRSYFGELTDRSEFAMFHYRHRPMELAAGDELQQQHQQSDEDSSSVGDISSEFTISADDEKRDRGKLYMPYKDIMEFKEMRPPDIMPQGNIGTPDKHFLELINACRLPPVIVKKLQLKFKKKGGKFYSSVPFVYSSSVKVKAQSDSSSSSTPVGVQLRTGPAYTALRHQIFDHEKYMEEKRLNRRLNKSKDQANRDLKHVRAHMSKDERKKKGDNEESDGETEEWDRHEAFNDDPANVERNKERLFEEEIELKWEKGGSGLVFYTDAQYWKQLEGDFDEQTADDWDVDMSEYYEPGTGDKDARDYIRMRRDQRVRDDIANLEEISAFDKPIGAFEQHTKGKGRELLERQGWKEGRGVGREEKGRANIIDSDGQHPRDKRGFGFYGERVERFVPPGSRRKRRPDEPIISTVYDDPADTDERDELRERKNPHNIKHRPRT